MMLTRFAVLVCASLIAIPATAEISWTPAGDRYELTGAALFRLRDELPDALEESLKAIRNQVFGDEAAFRVALTAAGADGEVLEKLIEAAVQPGGMFGVEPRGEGMVTLYVEGPEPVLDDNAFTAKSWLRTLPDAAPATSIGTALEGGCFGVSEGNARLFELCEPEAGEDGTAAVLRTEARHVVGLGQEFQTAGDTSVERAGFIRHGFNVMQGFNGGANGNTLFPIAYFDHPAQPFALILDNRTQQEWDLTADDFRLRVWGGDFRLHVITGDTLADVRRRYMTMTGHPPVPPKAMFGLWLSEYGFDNWGELESKLETLREEGFPVSGAVLDLQWFGGIEPSSSASRMGSLRWDLEAFPDPRGKIAEFQERGIGIMLIEESYVSSGLPEHAALAAEGALAHDANGVPLVVNPNGNWWGKGGMIDWTAERAGAFWHDFRRQALIDDGVVGHWTDLGEPEMINPDFHYGDGLSEAQVHNSYNLAWIEGIAEGYARNTPGKRAFIMSRSGAMGMQAAGAAMWSGDTGSDFGSLAAQMPQQTHMMWSGLDYYGSDVGGFHRGALGVYPGPQEDAMDELYTQWLAYSALFEVPIRPHTENLCNCKETAPDRIGDVASNRANLLLRSILLPYYYSLAHQAYRTGEPVFPSLDYWFPDDEQARGLGHVKMIGPSLVAAAAAQHGAESIEIYLPQGRWFDFRRLTRIDSVGESLIQPLRDEEGLLSLPLYARDGAIIPLALGGATPALAVLGTAANSFDWYDDDGVSTGYQHGSYEHLRVVLAGKRLTIERQHGGSLEPRELSWVGLDGPVSRVLVNGEEAEFERMDSGVRLSLPSFAAGLVIEVE